MKILRNSLIQDNEYIQATNDEARNLLEIEVEHGLSLSLIFRLSELNETVPLLTYEPWATLTDLCSM